MEPLYTRGTSLESATNAFELGAFIFIVLVFVYFYIYITTEDEEEKRWDGIGLTVYLLILGFVIFLSYKNDVETINNRNSSLQVYENHLVLEDNKGHARTYDYEDIDYVLLNKEMVVLRERKATVMFESRGTKYENRDRVEAGLKDGQTDVQRFEGDDFWNNHHYSERIDLAAAEKALKDKVSKIELVNCGERRVRESPYSPD